MGIVELSGGSIDKNEFLRVFEAAKPEKSACTALFAEGCIAVGVHNSDVSSAPPCSRLNGSAAQPIVVADAIIDNRDELAIGLGIHQSTLASMSDAELIRLSYLKWGEQCVQHLYGDYAFAVVSESGRNIFLARDHIGSRPLYWRQHGRTILFGSTIKSLVKYPKFKWSIDERSVAEYLHIPVKPISGTFFSDLQSVSSGSFVKIHNGRATEQEWWKPSTRIARIHRNSAEAISECRDIVERAITDRVKSSRAIGSHISGGIDSTGITLLAHEILRSQHRTLTRAYSWVPPESLENPIEHPRDERSFINSIASAHNISVTYGSSDEENLLDFLSRPLEFETQADLVDEIPILKKAMNDNIGVMLSGWGADEVFSSHARKYAGALLYSGKLSSAKKFIHNSYGSLRRQNTIKSLILRELILPLLPGFLYSRVNPTRLVRGAKTYASKALLEAHKDELSHRHETMKLGYNQSKTHLRQLKAGHLTMRMESWASWSAQHGFQYRYPLLDRRLLEFLLMLPPEYLFAGYRPRGLARAVFNEYGSEKASKEDRTNEAHKKKLRFQTWSLMAASIKGQSFEDDCPWLDKKALVEAVSNPREELGTNELATYIHIFSAMRIWNLYRRAKSNGWVEGV